VIPKGKERVTLRAVAWVITTTESSREMARVAVAAPVPRLAVAQDRHGETARGIPRDSDHQSRTPTLTLHPLITGPLQGGGGRGHPVGTGGRDLRLVKGPGKRGLPMQAVTSIRLERVPPRRMRVTCKGKGATLHRAVVRSRSPRRRIRSSLRITILRSLLPCLTTTTEMISSTRRSRTRPGKRKKGGTRRELKRTRLEWLMRLKRAERAGKAERARVVRVRRVAVAALAPRHVVPHVAFVAALVRHHAGGAPGHHHVAAKGGPGHHHVAVKGGPGHHHVAAREVTAREVTVGPGHHHVAAKGVMVGPDHHHVAARVAAAARVIARHLVEGRDLRPVVRFLH